MSRKRLILPILLSLATAAALIWLLGSWQQPVGAAHPPPPTPMPRFVAVSGSDTDNDCLVPSQPCRTIQHAVDLAWSGSVIRVAGGTYSDVQEREGASQVVYLDRRLTLKGGYTTTNRVVDALEPSIDVMLSDGDQEVGVFFLVDDEEDTVMAVNAN